ncbi:MAG: DUF503 domain-containing protein [Candidatus Omnitrophica bacterium]|nr:DUF503 domain-containing protein [Candidatus Omnitrophota bacterium]
MVIGILQMVLRIPEAQSLKEKRWVLKSLVTRLRNKFNISVSEVDSQDSWQMATLAISHVSKDRAYSNEVLDQVINFTSRNKQIEVVDSQLEFL